MILSDLQTIKGRIQLPYSGSVAALIVDMQETFMEGGGLAVGGSRGVVERAALVGIRFSLRVATRDLHPRGHISLASSYRYHTPFYVLTREEAEGWTPGYHGIANHALFGLDELREYLRIVGCQTLWPDHALELGDSEVHPLIQKISTVIWNKGFRPSRDSYSAFRENGGDDTGLGRYFKERRIDTLVAFGIAYDVCLGYSALDARAQGFEVYVVTDLCPAISQEGADAMTNRLIKAGVHLVTSDQILDAA